MNINFELLKGKALEFVQSQPRYNEIKNEKLNVTYGEFDGFFILVGEDLQIGIGGFGKTPELAFQDFVRSWNQFNGAEWIIKNR